MHYSPLNKDDRNHTYLINKRINWKFDDEWDSYIVSNYLPAPRQIPVIISNYTVEKAGTRHSNQVIKVNITSHGTNENSVPSDRLQWEEYSLVSAIPLPKMNNPN